jgi:hypothetical protein
MLTIIKEKAKTKNNIIMMIGLFIFFLGLYIFLDFEGNTNYENMISNFGIFVTITHISINIIIAILTSIMVSFSIINYQLTKVEPKGSNAIPFISFLFGLLTFGCTSCIVAFFAAIGIAFSPIILPNGNLVWKFAALLLVSVGFIWIMYSINTAKCKVKI